MNFYKLQFMLMFVWAIFILDAESIKAQQVFSGDIQVNGGDVYLSNRITEGPRMYGRGSTWTGIKDQINKWVFLSKKDNFSSLRSNTAQVKVSATGKVEFIGSPVRLTYTAFDLVGDFTSDDMATKSMNNNKAADYYTALVPQYANRTWIGIPDKQMHSVFTTNIFRTYERSLSDKRVKNDIKPLKGSLQKILSLNGYSYKYNEHHPFFSDNDKQTKRTNLGFIAQELQKVIPELVVMDEHVGYLMVQNYEQLFPVIVEAIKEQQILIEEKDQLVADLIDRLEKLENATETSQQVVEDFSVEVSLSGSQKALLSQNHPNPFNGLTNINFFVPHASDSARIQIFDQNGRLWKSINVTDRGHGNLKIQTTNIPSGTFVYNLEVNGKIIATKKMIISE